MPWVKYRDKKSKSWQTNQFLPYSNNFLFPKNSQNNSKDFPKTSRRLPKEFQKNSKIQKISQDFENIKFPTLHLEAENPFRLALEQNVFSIKITFIFSFYNLLLFLNENLFCMDQSKQKISWEKNFIFRRFRIREIM